MLLGAAKTLGTKWEPYYFLWREPLLKPSWSTVTGPTYVTQVFQSSCLGHMKNMTNFYTVTKKLEMESRHELHDIFKDMDCWLFSSNCGSQNMLFLLVTRTLWRNLGVSLPNRNHKVLAIQPYPTFLLVEFISVNGQGFSASSLEILELCQVPMVIFHRSIRSFGGYGLMGKMDKSWMEPNELLSSFHRKRWSVHKPWSNFVRTLLKEADFCLTAQNWTAIFCQPLKLTKMSEKSYF